MKTVKEVSRLTGVSVRTLHHYDAIGLLKPTAVTEAGYRLYDDGALRRLQSILLFRELGFPLKEIREILDRPDFDMAEALTQQIKLLELQQKRIGELILHAREIRENGAKAMNFNAFDTSEIQKYTQEARAKWGSTGAYREYEQRKGAGEPEGAHKIMTLFAELGGLKHLPPSHGEVQEKIAALQSFITENYYTCTPEILRGLGRMYVDDERFRRNIDSVGGEGTAEFAGQAIEIYCPGK